MDELAHMAGGIKKFCRFRQRLHEIESVWNRYEIGMDKPYVYMGPSGSAGYSIVKHTP